MTTPKEVIVENTAAIAADIQSGLTLKDALEKYVTDSVSLNSLRVAYNRINNTQTSARNKSKGRSNKSVFDLDSALETILKRADDKIAEHVDPLDLMLNSEKGIAALTTLKTAVETGKLKISDVREFLVDEGIKISPTQLKQVFANLGSSETTISVDQTKRRKRKQRLNR